MATDFVKKNGKLRTFVIWHSETEWDDAVYMHDLKAPLMPLYHVKVLVKIGPVVSAMEIVLRVHVLDRRISSYLQMYWTDFRNFFTI